MSRTKPGTGNTRPVPAPATPRPAPKTPPRPVTNPFTPAAPLSSEQASARDAITTFLGQYGLASLGTFAWNEYLKGVPLSQIMLDIRNTPEYKTRFPAMADLAAKGKAMSEAQYINLEQAYTQVLHSYGLPAGFYDKPADFATFMTGDVSPAELNDRVKEYTSVVMGDTETLKQLQTLYGEVGHGRDAAGDLLAHYLDPTAAAPLLTQQLSAAQFAATGKTSGYGQLTAEQATRFGARRDTSEEEAEQGFASLVHGKELFTALPGQAETDIGQDVQLGAAFGGDVKAQEAIQKRASSRIAAGKGGGGFTTTQRGIEGLGSRNV